MRRLRVKLDKIIIVFVMLGVLPLCAGEITCATWNMEWFPSGIANRRMPHIEPDRILKASEVVKEASPCIIFVQEVRDKESCEKLADAGGNRLKVAACSNFNGYDGIPVFQQCSILTSYPVLEARSEGWHSYGVVDPPRGYAYALLDIKGSLVACYCVHLKSNLTRKESDAQMNILKRELASTQILEHVRASEQRKDRQITKFIIAGDFNTNLDDHQYLSEGTIRNLLDSGFKNCFEGLDKKDRVTLPSSGRYPDVTFDFILYKGFDKAKSVMTMPTADVSDHRMVVALLKALD